MSNGTPMFAPSYPTGSQTKGGGQRGGPKRWTGAGPRPARHIPWPEIFKHHISVVEGHLKMLDMIRKHTVPNTGNWRAICAMVDRANEMLRMSKDATRSFVPPSNERERVPIGSSSASMYPGYSPADHQYGEAAQEFGAAWSDAKSQGVGFKPPPDGPQYEMAQARGVKKRTLAGIRAAKAARGEGSGSGSGSGSEAPTARSTSIGATTNGNKQDVKSEDDTKEDGNPYFVIDTNPTPVSLPGISHQPAKRTSDEQSPQEPTGHRKSKKAKTRHEGEPAATKEKRVEFEDISEEVDARLKEKEEKRKRKDEKKRKRVSDEALGAAPDSATKIIEVVTEVEKPKKKKSKKAGENGEIAGAESVVPAKRSGSSGDEAGGESGKKKKKLKKSKEGKENMEQQ